MTDKKIDRQYYNREGKLIAYEGSTPGCNFGEVLAVRIEERMGRIESNIGSTRIAINEARMELNKVKEDVVGTHNQVTGLCNIIQKYLSEIQVHINKQEELEEKIEGEDGLEKCTQRIKRKFAGYDAGIRVTVWIVGLGFPIAAGLIFALWKFFV